MQETVILVEVDAKSPAGVATTLRFSDRPIPPFPPSDATAANVSFDERVIEAPSLKRALFDDLASLSPALGFGEMALVNADRGLDAYQGHSWGEIRVDVWTEGTPRADALPILKALCGQPGFPVSTRDTGRVRVPIYDYRVELEKPLQETVYSGAEGALWEGEATGAAGRRKPLAYGDLLDAHVSAPQVNGPASAYQVNDGPIAGPILVLDRGLGAGFAPDGDKASAVFDTWVPAPAHSLTDLSRGLVRWNGQTVGQVAFGLKGSSNGGYVETAGPIIARMLAKAGVPPARIGASVASLAAPAKIGAWFENEDARTAIGWIARSALAAVLPGRLGVWEALAFGPPKAVADHVVASDEIIDIDDDASVPAPAGEIRVGWSRVYTGYRQADLHQLVISSGEAARLTNEYRWAVIDDAAVKAAHPRTWRRIEITTALRTSAAATALATALKGLFGLRNTGAPRRMRRVTVEMTPARLGARLGDTVQLQATDLGAEGNYVLLGEEPCRPRRDQMIWTLWG